MLKLWIKDNSNGHIHEYGTNQHDSLYIENGALHYENLQCCAGTKFPEEGYSFCMEDGTIPDFTGYEGYLDIGGEFYTPAKLQEPEKAKMDTPLNDREQEALRKVMACNNSVEIFSGALLGMKDSFVRYVGVDVDLIGFVHILTKLAEQDATNVKDKPSGERTTL